MWPREEAIEFFAEARRTAQSAADRGEDGRPAAGVVLHDQGSRHVRRLLRRPARALDQSSSRPSSCSRRRTRTGKATRRTSRCSASTARRSSRRRSSTSTSRALEEAKKRDHRTRRQGARAVHGPSLGAGRDVLAAQGHAPLQHARQLHARRVDPGRISGSESAHHLQQGAVGDVRALGVLPRQHVSREVGRRRGDGAQADELPRPLSAVRQRDAQLQGPSAALPRADAAPPQRSVRRPVRADARPSVLAGRWALLRHRGADWGRSRSAAGLDSARVWRFRP